MIRCVRLCAVVLCMYLSGCSLGLENTSPQKESYLLLADIPSFNPVVQRHKGTLLVRDVDGNQLVNSRRILFREDGLTFNFYKLAQWVEPPTKRLSELLLSALEQSQQFEAVVGSGTGALAEWSLQSELLEFHHDTRESPGTAHVSIRVNIVDNAERKLVATQLFQHEAKVSTFDARGAVAALGRATKDTLADILAWIAQNAKKLPA